MCLPCCLKLPSDSPMKFLRGSMKILKRPFENEYSETGSEEFEQITKIRTMSTFLKSKEQ